MAHGFGMVAFAVLYVAHHVFALSEFGVGFECAVGPGDGVDMVVALGFDVGHHGHGQGRGGVGLDGMCGAVGGTVDHVHLYQAVGLVGQGIGGVALLQQGHGFGVFDSVPYVGAIAVPGAAEWSRKELDALTEWVKRPQVGSLSTCAVAGAMAISMVKIKIAVLLCILLFCETYR